ncbi:MAG: PD-(D/E)XK nuclease family protein [Chamaesiphon sp. CSU_1_12]|nr:PD-(D/E)XK nuclease family protein [Chamaesiphon sp. CSU_1_12]
MIDWKTYPLPKYKKDLDLEWQTRLYLYLLAETSDYLPKQIAFTYWFIQSTPQPKSVSINYTLKQHRQTQIDLLALLEKIDNLARCQSHSSGTFSASSSVYRCVPAL